MEERKDLFCKYCGAKLDSEVGSCKKCGKQIMENDIKLEAKDVSEKKIKTKKKVKAWVVLLAVIAVIVVGAASVFCYLLNTGYLYQQGYLKTIYDVTGICLEHHYMEADCTNPEICEICSGTQGTAKGHSWLEADCTNPEICEICSATQGTAKGHTWSEATCEKPKECSVCQETEGEALGHTVLIGKCDNCNEFQYEIEGEFISILTICQKGSDYTETAMTYFNGNISTVYSAYLACSSANSYYTKAKSEYQKAYDACGDYDEFKTLKSKIKAVINMCPTSKPSNNLDSCQKYLEKARDCALKEQEYAKYVLTLMDEWNLE